MKDAICQECQEAAHITLRCRNHPEKEWSTKNISFIGARTIFYNLMSHPEMGPECQCSAQLLYHDHARDGARTEA